MSTVAQEVPYLDMVIDETMRLYSPAPRYNVLHYNYDPLHGTMYVYITGYGSTLYIGIAMVFVFFPYIWKFTSCF